MDVFSDTFVPIPAAGILATPLDTETLLFDDTTGRVHVLSPTAALTWACFDGKADLGEIVADLSEVFGVDPEEVRSGVVSLVRELAGSDLLDNRPDGGTGAVVPTPTQAASTPHARAHPPRPESP